MEPAQGHAHQAFGPASPATPGNLRDRNRKHDAVCRKAQGDLAAHHIFHFNRGGLRHPAHQDELAEQQQLWGDETSCSTSGIGRSKSENYCAIRERKSNKPLCHPLSCYLYVTTGTHATEHQERPCIPRPSLCLHGRVAPRYGAHGLHPRVPRVALFTKWYRGQPPSSPRLPWSRCRSLTEAASGAGGDNFGRSDGRHCPSGIAVTLAQHFVVIVSQLCSSPASGRGAAGLDGGRTCRIRMMAGIQVRPALRGRQ